MIDRPIATGNQYANSGNPRKRWNRTGATLATGSVGFVDHIKGDAASTSWSLGESNVVAVTTARIAMRPQLVVHVDTGATPADDKEALWYDGENVICYARVDSTTDIAAGDWLKPVNAGDHLVKATLGTDYVYAQALEARTSNDEGLIRVRLFSQGKL